MGLLVVEVLDAVLDAPQEGVGICQRLRRSRETGDQVAWLVANHLRHVQAPKMRCWSSGEMPGP